MTGPQLASTDPQGFLEQLAESIRRALPPDVVANAVGFDRKRTLADRVAGRPGPITRIRLTHASTALTLGFEPGPRWQGEVARVSGGVVISRRSVGLGEWLTTFAGLVAALAADAAGDAAAASRALQLLGLEPAGSEAQVRDGSIETDLQTLPGRLGDRVPADAVAEVRRIAELLLDTLPRVAGEGEPELVVRRTATVYLPDTLRAYLALPADWAAEHRFADGTTPAAALVAQLRELEEAARKMRDAAVERDASALLVNGRFLAERFASSRIDLA